MNKLPQKAHPTAKAFFDALDEYNQHQVGGDDDKNEDDAVIDGTATSPEKPFMSESLKRKSQSLGWRNRNSQNEYYPITVNQSFSVSKDDADGRPTQQQSAARPRPRKFSVRQFQRGEVDGTFGTGATVWPAAMVLIKYLERTSNFTINRNSNDTDTNGKINHGLCEDSIVTLRGKHVIDLGGGTGVTSIAAALLGATSVVCTDGEESVVGLAHDNILRASHQLSELSNQNSDPTTKTHATQRDMQESFTLTSSDDDDGDTDRTVSIDACPIRAQKYWWGEETSRSLLSSTEDNGLVILVADCVLPKLYPIAPLVQAIDDCLRLHDDEEERKCDENPPKELSSSFAILSYEHRYYPDYDPRIEFRRLASKRCLDVIAVPRDEMDPVYSLDDVEIWIVRRRR